MHQLAIDLCDANVEKSSANLGYLLCSNMPSLQVSQLIPALSVEKRLEQSRYCEHTRSKPRKDLSGVTVFCSKTTPFSDN